jgi:hypothetical protein
MNVWGTLVIAIVVIPAGIGLGLIIHLIVLRRRNEKLGDWIVKEMNKFSTKVWEKVFENHALNANQVRVQVVNKDMQMVTARLLEFYSRQDLVFYFDQIKEFGTDEDIVYGMEYLEEETLAIYAEKERVVPAAEMAKRYFRRCKKRPLNDK